MSVNETEIKRAKYISTLDSLKHKCSQEEENIIGEIIKFIENSKLFKLNYDNFVEEVEEKLNNDIIVVNNLEEHNIIKNKSFPTNAIVEGDNLLGLDLLLKAYKSKVDVIYIDPPYNAEAASATYKDSFPKSEWLSMIQKRLEISKKLLIDGGTIYVSIDEASFAELKVLMDSIFGSENFVENFIWVKNASKNNSGTTSTIHEYILCYTNNMRKLKEKSCFKVPKTNVHSFLVRIQKYKKNGVPVEEIQQIIDKELKEFEKEIKYRTIDDDTHYEEVLNEYMWRKNYNRIDSNYRVYTRADLTAPGPHDKDSYDIIHPITNKPCKKPKRKWAFKYSEIEKMLENDEIWFGTDENSIPRKKNFLDNLDTSIKKSIIYENKNGIEDLENMVNHSKFGNTAKPVNLIKKLLEGHDKNSLILDFYAGSGTTGQAVTEMNEEDGGNRKFILITNNENNNFYDTTLPRVSNSINGYNGCDEKNTNLLVFQLVSLEDDKEQTFTSRLEEYSESVVQLLTLVPSQFTTNYILKTQFDLEFLESGNVDIFADVRNIYHCSSNFIIPTKFLQIIKESNIKLYKYPECYFKYEIQKHGEIC